MIEFWEVQPNFDHKKFKKGGRVCSDFKQTDVFLLPQRWFLSTNAENTPKAMKAPTLGAFAQNANAPL